MIRSFAATPVCIFLAAIFIVLCGCSPRSGLLLPLNLHPTAAKKKTCFCFQTCLLRCLDFTNATKSDSAENDDGYRKGEKKNTLSDAPRGLNNIADVFFSPQNVAPLNGNISQRLWLNVLSQWEDCASSPVCSHPPCDAVAPLRSIARAGKYTRFIHESGMRRC